MLKGDLPSMVMLPEFGCISANMQPNIEVFPAPFGPIRPKASPFSIANETPSTARTLPRLYVLVNLSTVMIDRGAFPSTYRRKFTRCPIHFSGCTLNMGTTPQPNLFARTWSRPQINRTPGQELRSMIRLCRSLPMSSVANNSGISVPFNSETYNCDTTAGGVVEKIRMMDAKLPLASNYAVCLFIR